MKVAQLDPSLAAAVRKELRILGERMRSKHVEDRKRYRDLFQQPLSKGASEGSEETSVEQEEQAGYGLTAEKKQNNPEATKYERELGAKNSGTNEGNVVEEEKGLLVKAEERKKEDLVPQKKREETATAKPRGTQDDLEERQLFPSSGSCMVEGSEDEQQSGPGLQEAKVEVEAAEMNSEVWEKNGEIDSTTLTGKQDLRANLSNSDGMAVKPMNVIEEGSREGQCETEVKIGLDMSTGKGEYEGSCESRETEAHNHHWKQANVDVGSEHVKEGMRVKCFEEEDCSQAQQEKSQRGKEESNGLDLVEEVALRKEKGEIGDHSKPEKKLCRHGANCYEANREVRVPAIEDSGKIAITSGASVDTNREARDNHEEKAGCDKEGINIVDNSSTWEKVGWDELGLEYFEAELIPSTEAKHSKIGPQGTTSDMEQVDLQATWEDPEKREGTEQI